MHRRVICHRHGVVLGPFAFVAWLIANATMYNPITHRSMPRGKKLTEDDMGKVKAFHETNMSQREIVRRMGRSQGVVEHFLNDPVAHSTYEPAEEHQS